MLFRTRTFVIVAGLLLVVAVFNWWPEPEPRYPTTGSSVVVFGDSLAAGVGATPGRGIAGRLSEELSVPVHNLGVPGDTTADALARLDAVLAKDPRVVIVLLGGNDAIQRKPVAQTFANLEEIVRTIQAYGAAVVLVGEPGGLYGRQYAQEYERLAKTYRTFYVPNILDGLLGDAAYMDDLIHPNSAGYAKATARITPAVTSALRGGDTAN